MAWSSKADDQAKAVFKITDDINSSCYAFFSFCKGLGLLIVASNYLQEGSLQLHL